MGIAGNFWNRHNSFDPQSCTSWPNCTYFFVRKDNWNHILLHKVQFYLFCDLRKVPWNQKFNTILGQYVMPIDFHLSETEKTGTSNRFQAWFVEANSHTLVELQCDFLSTKIDNFSGLTFKCKTSAPDISPSMEVSDTPILNFWWRQSWILKPN